MALKKARGSNKTTGLCKLVIETGLTIYEVEVLKQGLDKQLDNYDRFEINLSDVTEIDSAGIQLLLAFRSELQRQNKTLKLTNVCGVVAKLFEQFAINNSFDTGKAS